MFVIENLKFKNILDIPRLVIDQPVTCIVGASGSGKTTLLRHLNRLYTPEEGRILYNGEDLARLDPVEVRRKIVMLGQTPIIYDGTVGENLQIGLVFSQKPEAGPAEISAVLESVGLPILREAYCDTLSGGEKQRLCLARVLLMDAEVYLLDEPSAALDRETELFVIGNLAEFVRSRGKKLVIVTHSQAIAELFPEGIVRIGGGKLES